MLLKCSEAQCVQLSQIRSVVDYETRSVPGTKLMIRRIYTYKVGVV